MAAFYKLFVPTAILLPNFVYLRRKLSNMVKFKMGN